MSILDDLGVEFVEKSGDLTVQHWTVSEKMTQIHGVLHGGLSAAIAEQGAGMGATLAAGSGYRALGLDITSHHLKPAWIGQACETRAWPESAGGKVQVWRVEQRFRDTGELFNVSSVTLYLQEVKDGQRKP